MSGGDWVLTVVMALFAAGAMAGYWWAVTNDRSPLVPVSVCTAGMLVAFYTSGVALPQPTADDATHTTAVLVVAAIFIALNTRLLIHYARKGDARLVLGGLFAGCVLYPFLVEPSGDIFDAVYYPENLGVVATIFGRDMPYHVPLIYATGIAVMMTTGYRVARTHGAQGLLIFCAVSSVLEVPFEMISAHYGWMHYYSNHAMISGVPIALLVQNGGFVAVGVAAVAYLEPLRGPRLALVPVAQAGALVALAMVGTFPVYLTSAFGSGPVYGWAAGIFSLLLNLVIVVACAKSPAVARLRTGVEAEPSTRVAPAMAVA